MERDKMERVLLGDNQFFGVNHMSEEKARAQMLRFNNSISIMNVLDTAYDLGIKTFMCTTHEKISDICQFVRENPNRYREFKFYPGMPYAHKYANAVTDQGMMGALKMFTTGSVLGTLSKGSSAFLTQDIIKMMKMLVDAELKMFEGLNTSVIFLQNAVVDLLLGLGMKSIFTAFARYIKEKYKAEPGFITMNLPALLDVLEECNIYNPIVCSSINKIGFRMCGGIELYEKTIRERRFRPIAMSTLASGAISPEEAIEYVCRFDKIESIVFGASSYNHIKETNDLINTFSNS